MTTISEEAQDLIDSTLVYLSVYDTESSPWSFAMMVRDENEKTLERWQLLVEVFFRLLTADLLRSTHYVRHGEWAPWSPDSLDAPPKESIVELAVRLSQHNPYSNPADEAREDVDVWIGPLLYATPSAKALLAKYRIDDYDQMTPEFFREVEGMFDRSGVPWQHYPLIAVAPQGGEA
ncbi:hypothetical protein [Hydrogenophaga sp. 5NK40-0174]|uniref:hypothetical protein n=1 Tax=Hydrogenophaga sp. 5NK40-0174 TaxID=3127649 RepID=UPI0031024A05